MTKQMNPVRLGTVGALIAALGLLATVPFNMGGCSVNQSTVTALVPAGQQAIKSAAMTSRNERALGESVSLALTNTYGVIKDQQLARYVVLVGQTLASKTKRADQPWVFGVLDTDTVNAYSGPGGFVWITRGAIQQMQDESELAGVIAHEMGHVILGHGLAAARAAGFQQAGGKLVGAFDNTAQFANLTDTVTDGIVKTGFTQNQEFEADQQSIQFTAAAGYDPNGLLHFLQRIRDKQKAGGTNLFSTHPGMDQRIARVAEGISAAGTGGMGATLPDRFKMYTGGATTQPAARLDVAPVD
jgi:predicted Zn-dependent protease